MIAAEDLAELLHYVIDGRGIRVVREETIARTFTALNETVPETTPAPARSGAASAGNPLPRDGEQNSGPPGNDTPRAPLHLVPEAAANRATDTADASAGSAAARRIASILHTEASEEGAPGELLAEALLIYLFGHCAPSSKSEADTLMLATAEPLVRELMLLADDTDAGAIGLLALTLAPFLK